MQCTHNMGFSSRRLGARRNRCVAVTNRLRRIDVIILYMRGVVNRKYRNLWVGCGFRFVGGRLAIALIFHTPDRYSLI